jgi:hypothetical protein
MIPISAERDQDDAFRSRVDELPAHCRVDARQMIRPQYVFDPLN